MKGHGVKYSEAELQWIKKHRRMTRRQLRDAFADAFGRVDVTVDHIKALCTRNGWATGRTGRYEPGAVPSNKGKKMPFNANSAKTQFRKGQEPHNTRYLGHERVSKDGYIEISVAETNPHTGYDRRYVLKHRWLWEKANGPVPKGMALKNLDGNRLNTDPSNWQAVPKGLLPRLAGRWTAPYDSASDELKPAILTAAKIKHKLREARKP